MKKRDDRNEVSEGAIFARLWETADGLLSPRLARAILKLRFSEADNRRMHALALENQHGRLSPREKTH